MKDTAPRPIATSGGLVFDDAGRCLLIRTHKWRDRWGTPGGKIERGETMVDAFVREVREETGLDVIDVRFVLAQDAIDHPEFWQPAHFILLNFTGRVRGDATVTLNDEAQQHRWVTLTEALDLPLNQPTRVLILRLLAEDPR